MKDFHCCATCVHFTIIKEKRKSKRFCERLGYETDPKWKFNCWTPKEHVVTLMKKDQKENR
ncbi:hypothetical protein N780_13035 [Pontibacillus chungwhensis BH030062]|uniref:Uncharacterized protein n=1 Tax=Pontibacillus chungwhensis BH030062 TaxID=1385513 RepID=A0A0A2V2C8_9BACI|nr:hypothetical protein [Pontibacillus chungwhensis]KGP93218.1 hypothetical protein N780_13035 [Pontibacillus chungwhensis BH030062]